jgi:hypothetical protein
MVTLPALAAEALGSFLPPLRRRFRCGAASLGETLPS